MKIGLFCLVLGYVLSQFYRAFLAVLSPVLGQDLGTGPEDLALSSGLWFIAFAAAQIPVGAALDRVGPRLTAALPLALGGGMGAAIFAMATGPNAIHVAMVLIGIGCSPVLMAGFFIFARSYSVAIFATLAGALIGFGSIGNLAASLPLAWAVEAFGWRGTMWALALVTFGVAILFLIFIKDPEKIEVEPSKKGSVLDLLKMPQLWFIFPLMAINYAPAAGLRGLWAGPFMSDIYGMDAQGIGLVTMGMGVAMIAGTFAYGPADRIFGTRKWVVLTGNVLSATAVIALAIWPQSGLVTVAILLAAAGFFGTSFPMIMAHGRAFVPEHLTGRGVTLLNLFGIGGAGVMQFVSGPMFRAFGKTAEQPVDAYAMLFASFGIALLIGCFIYLFSRDRTD